MTGFPNAVASTLADNAEYRIPQIVEVGMVNARDSHSIAHGHKELAATFMRHARQTTMITGDIN